MTRFRLLSLAGLFIGALTACSSPAGTGGITGTGASGGGCPLEKPLDGSSCTDSRACSYAVTANECHVATDIDAACVDGVWRSPVPATCGPLRAAAACDPIGTWHVELAWPDSSSFVNEGPNAFDMTIRASEDGTLLVGAGAGGAKIGPDGCWFSASWLLDYEEGEVDGEWATWTTQVLTLVLSGEAGTGTVVRACEGECGGEDTGTAAATRVSD